MKTLSSIFLFCGVVHQIIAQSAVILPNSIEIPRVSVLPGCDDIFRSRQVFNGADDKMYYCNGSEWVEMAGGGFSIPYSGTAISPVPLLSLESVGLGQAIKGKSEQGLALTGESTAGVGVYGFTINGKGVSGYSRNGNGVYGESDYNYGVYGFSWTNFSGNFYGSAKVSSSMAIGSLNFADVQAALHIKSDNSGWGQHIRLENYQDSGYAEILHDNDGLKFRNFQAGEGFYFRNSTNNTMARIDEEGNLTVKSNKGIVRSETGSQLKYYSRKITYGATLGAFSTFIGDVIPIATFSGPPQVYIANVEDQSGDYYKVVITPVAVTNDSVRFRFYNASNTSSTFTGTWNIVAVGPE